MDHHKHGNPPYPTDDNRPYPPPYTELPTNAPEEKPHPLYPPPPPDGLAGTSNIPHVYPPYPPVNPPPVTSPPSTYPPPTSGVTTIQIVDVSPNFGSESQYVRCPNCGVQSYSKTENKANTTTHLIALLLCCFILWPIAWLPYVCSACQSTVHYCSNCNQYLGERNT